MSANIVDRAGRMSARASPMVMPCGPRTYREGPGVGVVYPPCRPLRGYTVQQTLNIPCGSDVCTFDPYGYAVQTQETHGKKISIIVIKKQQQHNNDKNNQW